MQGLVKQDLCHFLQMEILVITSQMESLKQVVKKLKNKNRIRLIIPSVSTYKSSFEL